LSPPDQQIVVLIPRRPQGAGVEHDVALDSVVLNVSRRRSVDLHAEAIAVEQNVVADRLVAGLVLRVDTVVVPPGASAGAVVVNQATVDLHIRGLLPGADAIAAIVDHEVDELDARRCVDVDAVGDITT